MACSLERGGNAGILDAHERGILTSASLFAHTPATEDAIRVGLRTPTLAVGCHLTLVDGVPLLPPRRLKTLAIDGTFRPRWSDFIRDALLGRIAMAEVEMELTAQIERLLRAGLRPTHLDSHKHVHAFPPVFAMVARLAARFGIRAVRVPFEQPALWLVGRHFPARGPRRQALENAALGPWCRRDRTLLEAHRLPPARAFFGRVLTGLFTQDAFRALLLSLPEGASELMVHPGYPDEALDRVRTRLRQQRAQEVAF